jgi:uncharacterized protein (DUF1800 family)
MALIDKHAAPLTAKAAERLLRRTMFGAMRADIAALTGKSIDEALDILLQDQPTPPPPVEPILGTTWVNDTTRPTNDNMFNGYMKSWWVGLMATSPISLREKMTLFWHNHFPSQWTVVNDSRYMYKQNVLLRQNALGNFRTLVRDITIDPAMLRYLNGNRNTAAAPQENYARELQELFTIGKGKEIAAGDYTTYTEEDVRAAARVLTGWRDVSASVTATFTLAQHDRSDKQFSHAYQRTVIRGRNTANAGMEELNDLLDMIFRQNAVSEHICRKLYRFFVNFEITPRVEEEFIQPLAKTFREANYEIQPVLRQMFGSVHFFDENMYGCMIKSPLDLIVGAIRELNISLPRLSTQRAFYYDFMNQARNLAAGLQMDILEPPSVAGWGAYYQEPLFYQLWVNSATMPTRSNLANIIINGWTAVDRTLNLNLRLPVAFDSVIFAEQFNSPEDPYKLVQYFTEHFFAIDLTTTQRNQLLMNVFLPNIPPYEWTEEWNSYKQTPSNQQKRAQIKSKLDNLVRYMMQIAEYQIM